MAHFPNKDLKLRPDDGGNRHRHNIFTYLPNYTASNPEDRNFGTLPHNNPTPHFLYPSVTLSHDVQVFCHLVGVE
jgi:hypothetical protein